MSFLHLIWLLEVLFFAIITIGPLFMEGLDLSLQEIWICF